ncbi:class E sortase [Rubrobacter xylanophilus]|uniref:class E sortase n=1 Tax=Rubrobacter xylanophilus TaxID=49319 RepID=UPI001F2B7403|nr:class E sortase [Rubrobacter xylanophilus]
MGLLFGVLAVVGVVGYSVYGGGSAVAGVTGTEGWAVEAPRGRELWLTVPRMERVREVPVRDAPADAEEVLDRGALHVRGTGFPWEEEANVYIAGHRLGYAETGSYLQFYDLPKLRKGDKILLRDAEGTTYTYRVFRKFVVSPDAVRVMEPLPGRNIVSLQTCTLPDYSHRLVVQGELVDEVVEPTS